MKRFNKILQESAPFNVAPDKPQGYYEFLNALQDSGAINMLEAPALLADLANIPRKQANKIFSAWLAISMQSDRGQS